MLAVAKSPPGISFRKKSIQIKPPWFGCYIRFGVCTFLIVWPASVFFRFGQFIQFDYGQATFGMPDHVKNFGCSKWMVGNAFSVIWLLMYIYDYIHIKCSKLFFSMQLYHVTHAPRSTRVWMQFVICRKWWEVLSIGAWFAWRLRQSRAIHLSFRKIFLTENLPGDPTSCPTNRPQSELLQKSNRKCNDIWTKFGFEVGCQVVPTGVSGYEGVSESLSRKKTTKLVSR